MNWWVNLTNYITQSTLSTQFFNSEEALLPLISELQKFSSLETWPILYKSNGRYQTNLWAGVLKCHQKVVAIWNPISFGTYSFCFFPHWQTPKFDHWQRWSLCLYILGSCPITLGYISHYLQTIVTNQSGKKCPWHMICKQIPRKGIISLILSVTKLGQMAEKLKRVRPWI